MIGRLGDAQIRSHLAIGALQGSTSSQNSTWNGFSIHVASILYVFSELALRKLRDANFALDVLFDAATRVAGLAENTSFNRKVIIPFTLLCEGRSLWNAVWVEMPTLCSMCFSMLHPKWLDFLDIAA